MPPFSIPLGFPFLWVLCAFLVSAVALVSWRKIHVARLEWNIRQTAILTTQIERIQLVYSELLAQANDLDQNSKYGASENLSQDWSRRFGIVCEELVRLGDMIPLIEELVERKQIRQGRDGILQSCRIAEKISDELSTVRSEQTKLLGDNSRVVRRREIEVSRKKEENSS